MWAKFYEAYMQNPFSTPFTNVECEKKPGAPSKKPPQPPQPIQSVEFGSPKYFYLCAVGGALSCGLTHTIVTPLDLIKCRIQTNSSKYRGIIQGFKVTYAEEGLRG